MYSTSGMAVFFSFEILACLWMPAGDKCLPDFCKLRREYPSPIFDRRHLRIDRVKFDWSQKIYPIACHGIAMSLYKFVGSK